MRLVFDIETDGFLDEASKVHCIVTYDLDTEKQRVFATLPGYPLPAEAVDYMNEADELIGHNIIKYDIPVLQKIYRGFRPKAKIIDTLVCTRLIWSDIADGDMGRVKAGTFPSKRIGSHALEAWGYRLKEMKGEYQGGWETVSQEMVDYCVQDVVVTRKLYEKIVAKAYSPQAIELEHRFASIIAMQERHGFGFDIQAAQQLYTKLVGRRLEIAAELKVAFPARYQPVETRAFKRSCKRWVSSRLGAVTRLTKKGVETGCYSEETEGAEFTSIEWVEFNPSSRHHIAARLKEMGWDPQEFTPNGQPKVDETILEKLPYPQAKLLAEHFLVEKRIGQLAEGDQAWLRLERKGRIHGSVNTNGAVTGRCTHSNPNVAQVPRVGSPYGSECRALFRASHGKVLVGADLSGLELRCLAHFMARYDDGAYAKILLEGDIHTVNQNAAGLPTRNDAKTFIYAFLYGAGDVKIGSIVLPNGTEEEQRSMGKKLKKAFLRKTPALRDLRDAVSAAAAKGWIKGLDGRVLSIRSAHAALNTLLQSAGALIAKQATVFAYDELCSRGYVFGKDWALVAHIHDELQVEARKEIADDVGRVLVSSMQRAGRHFNFRVPIDGEFKIGNTWADTH